MSRSFKSGLGTRNFTTFTCSSNDYKSGSVKTLVNFFIKGSVGGLQTFTCNNFVWHYQKCKDSPVLCVNCRPDGDSICSQNPQSTSTCWGANLAPFNTNYPVVYMNPCQGGCSKVQRETASSFTMKLGADLIPMYPAFNSIGVSVSGLTKTSVTVVTNTSLAGTIFCPFLWRVCAPGCERHSQGGF